MRIDSVRYDASGNATIVVSGGVSFFIPHNRIPEIHDLFPKTGDELPDEEPPASTIAAISEEEDALRGSIALCSRAEQSSLGLRGKLASRGFSRTAIEYALNELKRQGILDDVRYASIWARARAERRLIGPLLIQSELRARGFDESTAKSATAHIDFDSILEKAFKKELDRFGSASASREVLNHIILGLKHRGFRGDTIRHYIENAT